MPALSKFDSTVEAGLAFTAYVVVPGKPFRNDFVLACNISGEKKTIGWSG